MPRRVFPRALALTPGPLRRGRGELRGDPTRRGARNPTALALTLGPLPEGEGNLRGDRDAPWRGSTASVSPRPYQREANSAAISDAAVERGIDGTRPHPGPLPRERGIVRGDPDVAVERGIDGTRPHPGPLPEGRGELLRRPSEKLNGSLSPRYGFRTGFGGLFTTLSYFSSCLIRSAAVLAEGVSG